MYDDIRLVFNRHRVDLADRTYPTNRTDATRLTHWHPNYQSSSAFIGVH